MIIKGFKQSGAMPPLAPTVKRAGLSASNDVDERRAFDTARFILSPDDDFSRPYLAVPGVDVAFVWPLGVEGFEVGDQADLGRHKYLGTNEMDVDIVHAGETTVTLSGIFPGWTGPANMRALRSVFYAASTERGKILYLPYIFDELKYVICDNLRHSKPDDERTMDVSYSATFVVIASGAATKKPKHSTDPAPAPGAKAPSRGTSTFKATASVNTLRKIAQAVYGNAARWTDLYALNAKFFNDQGIATHLVPDYRLPVGTAISY